MAKLVNIRLSSNLPTIDVADGLDGKVSLTTNDKRFVILDFEDDQNIFKVSRKSRTYWMGENDKWAGISPDKMKGYIGKNVPGEFVTVDVSPYPIKGDDGQTRMVGRYTTFIMSHETVDTVVPNEGHDLLNEDGSIRIESKKRLEQTPATL